MRIGIACLTLAVLTACSGDSDATTNKNTNTNTSTPAKTGGLEAFHLATAPANPISVKELKTAAAADSVTVVGRVKDIHDRTAGFTIADKSLKPCNEREGDDCKTPWDYCCEPVEELKVGTANVEFREAGKVVRASMKGFHGIDHLKEVVVVGKPEKDAEGNVTVVAKGVYVKG